MIITEFLFSFEQGDVSQRARNCFIFEFLIIEAVTTKRKLSFQIKIGRLGEEATEKCQVLSPQCKAVEDVGGESYHLSSCSLS